MEQKKGNKKNYQAPEVEVFTAKVEQGFVGSVLGIEQRGSNVGSIGDW